MDNGRIVKEAGKVSVVIDKEVAMNDWYGCSDGVTTGYMKLKTEHVIKGFLN